MQHLTSINVFWKPFFLQNYLKLVYGNILGSLKGFSDILLCEILCEHNVGFVIPVRDYMRTRCNTGFVTELELHV